LELDVIVKKKIEDEEKEKYTVILKGQSPEGEDVQITSSSSENITGQYTRGMAVHVKTSDLQAKLG